MGHNASAALMRDGVIIKAALEERYTQQKNHYGFPYQSIESIIQDSGVPREKITAVCFSSSTYDPILTKARPNNSFSIDDHWRYFEDRFGSLETKYAYHRFLRDEEKFQYPNDPIDFSFLKDDHILMDMNLQSNKFKEEAVQVLSNKHNIKTENIYFFDHHSCHAYYAYYASPFRDSKCAVITLDGWGDGRNQTLFMANNNKLKEILSSTQNDLGRIYKFTTLLLGMTPDEHEFKVMGLAAYTKKKYYMHIYDKLNQITEVRKCLFQEKQRDKDLLNQLKSIFERERFDNVAGAVQLFVEDQVCELVSQISREFNVDRFVLGGGIAMNIKMSLAVSKLKSVKNIFVPASPGDDTLSIGALYYYNENLMQDTKCPSRKLTSMYLGSQARLREEDTEFLETNQYKFIYNYTPSQIAELISQGKILATFVGCAEFGARALGNRSILADPRTRESTEKLNKAIKSRDFWMPFALSCTDKYQHKIIENPKQVMCPFMSFALESNPLNAEKVIAAIHPYDKTIRPQVLFYEDNPFYYKVIDEFYSLTGVGALLNTSFNLHGNPIVETSQEVISALENSDLDGIITERFIAIKP